MAQASSNGEVRSTSIQNPASTIVTTTSAPDAPGNTVILLLVFVSNEEFIPDLLKPNSKAYKQRASRVKSQLEPVYRLAFRSFLRLIVLGFTPGSIHTETELVFSTNSSRPIPNTTQAATTLREAVESGNFSSSEDFIPALSDPNSQVFRDRVSLTRAQLEPVFRMDYTSFIQLFVIRFRSGSIISETGLIFNGKDSVPSADRVATTLREAVESGRVTIPINVSSIDVAGSSPDGVSPVHHSVFSCSLLNLCTLILAGMLNSYF
ncbi:hypothetical protein AGOR_G00192060 [Albula goreensis]|uniref:SEA domain-containing protein n=1 Tax=Albula goreensis TaxID=1534307 RepID=A0A8T3CVA6_9TELE|nr:hypothetical protein AGOR_G00192060 [Albula goreensis]